MGPGGRHHGGTLPRLGLWPGANGKSLFEGPVNRTCFQIGVMLGILIVATSGLQAGNESRDLASEVRRVFAARCAGCHGSDLARPRGRFGYVLDLARVAANREMVVPGQPAESELWVMVERGEMPPEDAPTGSLTAPQKEVIRAWIAAGAPAGSEPAPAPRPEPAAPVVTAPASGHLLHWVGRFHVVFVHFPIALLIAAAVGECWSMVRNTRVPWAPVDFCIVLGAFCAVITVALGWLHASGGHGISLPHLLALHRWLGTSMALGAVLTAASSAWDIRRGVRSWYTRGLVLSGALLIGLVAHFGGLLVHGEDFFDW